MKKIRAIALASGTGILVLWLFVFAFDTALDAKVGFDFDDTVCFSSPSFRAAQEQYGWRAMREGDTNYRAFWTEVNAHPERDVPKPVTLGLARAAKLLGCDPVIITARSAYGREPFIRFWQGTFPEIYFTRDKARIMRNDLYLVFFGDSDDDISGARSAGVAGVRILRSPASHYRANYHPGSLGEWVVPMSEGPAS